MQVILNGKELREMFRCVVLPVDIDDCWLWKGPFTSNGYGAFSCLGFTFKTHCLSYLIFKGELDPDLGVLHTCHVRKCLNPFHLYLGNQKRNMMDAYASGRRKYKFTLEQAEEIRKLHKEGYKDHQIAKKFNISKARVHDVIFGRYLTCLAAASEVTK